MSVVKLVYCIKTSIFGTGFYWKKEETVMSIVSLPLGCEQRVQGSQDVCVSG